MKLNFTKMHGAGNDYIYINCFEETVTNPESLAVTLSHRHFGIGSDGLVLIMPSELADFRMVMFNADGSEGNMCGNAIRCVGKYVYENNLTTKTELTIETKSGIKNLTLTVMDHFVTEVAVDMGKAILDTRLIPVLSNAPQIINEVLIVDNTSYAITCVSMGNPHVIVFCEDPKNINLEKIGPLFENHRIFPERTNTEFVRIIDSKTISMRVWERGSGETLACGTGACASVVAAVLNGFCELDSEITVKLLGGELKITYTQDGSVLMKGSATYVFDGTIEVID